MTFIPEHLRGIPSDDLARIDKAQTLGVCDDFQSLIDQCKTSIAKSEIKRISRRKYAQDEYKNNFD